MYELLELYEKIYDEALPVVCLDEKCVELRGDERAPLVGKVVRRDSEYSRHGTCNVFMMTEPKGGRHYVQVTEHRKKPDFAKCLKWLAARYPEAITIHLVMDNLNTHSESSLIDTYGEVEGRRIWARFTVHYTPKHASWLNQAEIAIGVMQRAALGTHRYRSIEDVRHQVTKFWATRRAERFQISWKFTTKKAKQWLKIFQSKH